MIENKKVTCLFLGMITVVCIFTFFINNQVIPADIMEARNLATAQEMVEYGNYLLPTLNGEPRLEKLPLPTWIAAGIEHITPGNLVAQRYAAGLAATLMTLFVFLLATRLTGNNGLGLVVSLVMATSYNVIMMGRTATWDIYTHSFMLGAIYFMVVALQEKGAQWKYFLLAGLFTGLSFLSKGPVSWYAMLLPFLISYFIVYGADMEGKKWPIAGMVLVALAVSFWWWGYVYFYYQDFAVGIVQKESANWMSYNVRPWYYYWQFAAEGGIWALFWITAIVYYFLNRKTKYQGGYTFAFIWFAESLVLLSVIPEKKTRYLLPLLVPGALLIGFYIYEMLLVIKTKYEKILFRINVIVIALILFALPIALFVLFYRTGQVSLFILILATICSWGFCTLLTMLLVDIKGINVTSAFIFIVLSMMMISAIYLIPIGSLFINEERHSIRLLRDNKDISNLPIYYNDREELRPELVYETNRRILKMNTDDTDAMEKALPFVLISSEPIEKILSGKNIVIEFIDTFDNNWQKKGSKRHNPNLVKEAAIIRAK